MAKLDACFSSGKNDWRTPQWLFDQLNEEFHFTLDPCSNGINAKCPLYYTEKDNGLLQDWFGHNVFVNPPYSHPEQYYWIEKCYNESAKPNTNVVALIPSRTDTRAFHNFIYGTAEIRFIKGRIKFELDDGTTTSTAPFPSLIAIWRSRSAMQYIDIKKRL